ncbi:FERM, ARHGEF and pleckstrin domain-containing protein 2-like [Corticium candelabrum]|uniref:FERM, ARHGEF and pleckstrin domain-containing protein 2-like n=1 Tax=Corticium candelabrum TaxID=121492 RepID=UPI002E2648FE|nr:FERM, ARHGEF and pleckstrin domain-containing protein 2-like [Corticium candelabrum]
MRIICEIHIYRSEPVFLTVKKSARGQSVWEELLRHVQINDSQYFGLQYTDSANHKCWLDLRKKVGKQLEGGNDGDSFPLELRVKFWPSDPRIVEDELVRCLLAVELHEWLQRGRLKCEQHTIVQMGALTLQSELGNYDSSRHRRGYASHFCISCYQSSALEAKMESLHQTDYCQGLSPSQCDQQILEVARKLRLYGLHQYAARDNEHATIELGLSCNGVLVLVQETVMNQFPWAAIGKSFIQGCVLYIELHPLQLGDTMVQVGFTMESVHIAKEVWKLCLEFHAFYYSSQTNEESVDVKCLSLSRLKSKYHCSGLAYKQLMEQRRNSFLLGPSGQSAQMLRLSSLRHKAVSEDMSDCRKSSIVLQRHSDRLLNISSFSSNEKVNSYSRRRVISDSAADQQQEVSSSDSDIISGDEDEGYDGDTGCGTPTHDSDDLPDVDIEQVVQKLSQDHCRLMEEMGPYYFVACEIRDTERSYCLDLELLNVQFRNQVVKSQLLSPRQVSELFGNLDLIQEFHKNFLAELEKRMAIWDGNVEKYSKCLIGDILKMRMACMKLYTSYITNETKIFELLGRWQQENSEFARVCTRFEGLETCHRPVTELFYRPFQRMIHYKELLKRLLQSCKTEQEDYTDTKEALEHIETALEHVDRSTKAAENARKMMRLHRELVGVANLLKRGRVCLLEGNLLKVGAKGPQAKFFFLFSDILLYAVKKMGNHLVAQGILPLLGMTVEELGEGSHSQLSFKILTEKISFVVIAGTVNERQKWVDMLKQTIWGLEHKQLNDIDSLQPKSSAIAIVAPILQPFDEVKRCMSCSRKFSLLRRKHNCKGCGTVVCVSCLRKFVPVGYSANLELCCDDCYRQCLTDGALARRDSSVIRHHSVIRSLNPDLSDLSSSQPEMPDIMVEQTSSSATCSSAMRSVSPANPKGTSTNTTSELKKNTWFHKSRERRNSTIVLDDLGPGGSESARSHSSSLLTPSDISSPFHVSLERNDSNESKPVVLVKRRSRSFLSRNRQQESEDHKIFQNDNRYNRSMESLSHNKVLLSLRSEAFDRDTEMSGYLFRKIKGVGGWKQFWTVSSNCCLYHYKDHNDSVALSSLPLPNFELSLPNKFDIEAFDYTYVFKLSAAARVHYYMADSKYSMDRWMELLSAVVKRSRTHRQLSRLAKHHSGMLRMRSYTIF